MKYYFDYELVQKGNMIQWKPVKEEDRYGIGMSYYHLNGLEDFIQATFVAIGPAHFLSARIPSVIDSLGNRIYYK
jgi:hypothetical protein